MSAPLQDKQYREWLAFCERIGRATADDDAAVRETATAAAARKARLLGDFEQFCQYYFPHYYKAPFGWFHKEAASEIEADPKVFAVLEFPREHAKSVLGDVLIPLYLKAKNQLTGMVVASANEDKAAGLLGDIQAELAANRRYLRDYGEQVQHGKWQDGYFATRDGVGFWAIGRGQSPRGIREGANRPNYVAVDDIDDAVIVRNLARVREAVDWVLGDLYGAASVKGARLVVLGNRIHRKGILAHLVGDTEPDVPKREGIFHLKVFATEDPRTRLELAPQLGGQPAWQERFSLDELTDKMRKMGYRLARREYYHDHMEEGLLFRPEDIANTVQPLAKYDAVVSYCDPSFKDGKSNDYKAVLLVGRTGTQFHVLKAWVKQASISAMVQAHYDMEAWCRARNLSAIHYLEGGFIQPALYLDEYYAAAKGRGFMLPISVDKRKKDNKTSRIEAMHPLFERGVVLFNAQEYHTTDMKTLREQLLSFPQGHDDGPDALEGAIYKLNQSQKAAAWKPMLGFRTGGFGW